MSKIAGIALSAVLTCCIVPYAWAVDVADDSAGRGQVVDTAEAQESSGSSRVGSDVASAAQQGQDSDQSSQSQSGQAQATASQPAADSYSSSYEVAVFNRTSSYGTQNLISHTDPMAQSCEIAMQQWDSVAQVVIIPSDGEKVALSALALAGAMGCPVLVAGDDSSLGTLASTLESLGVQQAITVGQNAPFSPQMNELLSKLPQGMVRLTGCSATDVQMAVYDFGKKHGLWKEGTVYVASDAASAASFGARVYESGFPVFQVGKDDMRSDQDKALGEIGSRCIGSSVSVVVLGGQDAVGSKALKEAVFCLQSAGPRAKVTEVAEENFCYASLDSASALAAKGRIGWDGLAVSSPDDFASAVAGVAAQTFAGKPFLAVSDDSIQRIAQALQDKGIEDLTYLNNGAGISAELQNIMGSHLGFAEVIYEKVGSLSELANAQVDSLASIYGYANTSKTDIMENMDANAVKWDDPAFYQFAVLSDGYSGAVTAEQLDAWIEQCAPSNSKFIGAGKYFIAAASKYNVNEVYLLAHAALESAWGSSALATGGISGYGGYYNFFGIGAYDSNPSNGAVYAKDHGWNTVEAAVMGAAEFISSSYVNQESNQNALYYMRWNVKNGAAHQYASSPLWASSIAKLMAQCYEMNGISMGNSGFRFLVPIYE